MILFIVTVYSSQDFVASYRPLVIHHQNGEGEPKMTSFIITIIVFGITTKDNYHYPPSWPQLSTMITAMVTVDRRYLPWSTIASYVRDFNLRANHHNIPRFFWYHCPPCGTMINLTILIHHQYWPWLQPGVYIAGNPFEVQPVFVVMKNHRAPEIGYINTSTICREDLQLSLEKLCC